MPQSRLDASSLALHWTPIFGNATLAPHSLLACVGCGARFFAAMLRVIPIEPDLEKALNAHHDNRETGARIFAYAYASFREGIERSGIELQKGQLTHMLRHTFASHFMMNGGNILVLQRALGHANLTMSMR